VTTERFTLDTNILFYSIDTQAGVRHALAVEIVSQAATCDCRITLQAVSEFYVAATRKGAMPTADAMAQALDWLDLFTPVSPSPEAVRVALALADSKSASYWDALLIATAAEAGCTAMLTEDLADGVILCGVRIINPFGPGALTEPARSLLSAGP
jgi:predicted nucleic acid-binding protein